MGNNTGKKCPSCGKTTTESDNFCPFCGVRLGPPQTADVSMADSIESQLLALSNEYLSVKVIAPEKIEFASQAGAQSPTQKMKIKYEAIATLDHAKKRLTLWERLMEISAGSNFGIQAESTIQRGALVDKVVHGHILFGGKYGFEYGKLRAVIKTITGKTGWDFKTTIWRPK